MLKKLLTVVVLLAAVTPGVSSAECTRMCNPEKSKPCGKGCIALSFTCHKDVTTACAGTKPVKNQKTSEVESHLNRILGLQD